MKQIVFVLFLLLSITTKAQNIQGKVVDEITGQSIPFVSLGIIGTKITSVTNENGEFIIKALLLPAKIRFGHVSYMMAETEVKQQEPTLIIRLKPATINLQDVSVDPYKGTKLLREALTLAEKHKAEEHYLSSFYRQLTTINGKANQIHEIFYDLRWTPSRVQGWLAKQTRFAENKEKVDFSLSNQSYFTFVCSGYIYTGNSNDHITLENMEKYEVEIDNYIEQAGQDIAVITCKLKKPKKNQYYDNSKYFIGVDDKKIYRLENQIFNLPLALSGNISLKYPPIAGTTATFKNNGDSITMLESISTKLYLSVNLGDPRFTSNRDLQYNIYSLLTTIDEDESLKSLKFTTVTRDVKDKTVIESIKYNPDFWKNNPIFKQTALEDKFIKMMESQNAFGTMINP